jgi:hypothetical protein
MKRLATERFDDQEGRRVTVVTVGRFLRGESRFGRYFCDKDQDAGKWFRLDTLEEASFSESSVLTRWIRQDVIDELRSNSEAEEEKQRNEAAQKLDRIFNRGLK